MDFSWLKPVLGWLDEHSGAVQAVFAGLLVVLTFFYVLFTNKLRRTTDLLADIADRERKFSEAVQRATLCVEPLGIHPFKDEMKNAAIRIRNVGRLPALNVSWVISTEFKSSTKWKNFERFEQSREHESDDDVVVAPDMSMTQASRPFETADLVKSRYVFILGAVFYDDGLGNSRTTRFCHRYPSDMLKDGRIEAEYARFHRFGNDTSLD